MTVFACSMRTRVAGFAGGAEFHASSRRDRIGGLVIGRIRGAGGPAGVAARTAGAFAVEASTTARPRPKAARRAPSAICSCGVFAPVLPFGWLYNRPGAGAVLPGAARAWPTVFSCFS